MTLKNIFIAVLASFCIAVYIVALLFTAVNFIGSVKERGMVIKQEWNDLEDLASAAGVLGFMNEPFIETIEDQIFGSKSLEGAIISGPNGEYAFERREGTVVEWVNGSPRLKESFGLKASGLRPLRIDGQRNVNLQALSSSIDYNILLPTLKKSLLMVLGALTLSFFVLLLESLTAKRKVPANKKPAEMEIDFDELVDSPSGSAEPFWEKKAESQKPEAGREPFPGFTPGGTPKQPASREEPRKNSGPARTPEEKKPVPAEPLVWENAPGKTAPRRETPPEPPKGEKESSGPKGLYSPRGGIGWKEYTIDRLTSELHRCSSFEQDLTVIVAEFREPETLDDDFFKQLADETVGFFANKDLVFENGNRGISIIFPNSELDQGFLKAEAFHSRLLNQFPHVFREKTDICMGISSRGGRLIEAERLRFEAEEALRRALADPVSPIVAFKSDPEKFRNFIASQNRPASRSHEAG